MTKLNCGVIGTGLIGPVHIEALRRLGYINIKAIADKSKDIAKQKAKKLSVKDFYGDYEKLLADDDIDVVHICTPNHLHYKMTKEAIKAGKHVVCEKPLALNVQEGEELVELANNSEKLTCVHFNIRFYPLVQQAKSMIQNGELGKIFAINGSYQQDWLFYDTDYNWRVDSKYGGKVRAVADIGSHFLDTIEYITDIKTNQVCSDFGIFYPTRKKPVKDIETYGGKIEKSTEYEEVEVTTEDYATVLLRFENGAHGSMTVNQVAAGRKNRLYFEIYGSKKSIAWNSERPNELWVGSRENANEQLLKDPSLMSENVMSYADLPGGHNEGFPDTSKQLFNNFYKSIIENEEYDYPRFEDGYRELLLCKYIAKSAEKECWFEVPDR